MDKIDQILEKLHLLDKKVDKNAFTLERNTDDLAEHIRRTNLLEEQMKVALLPIKWSMTTVKIVGALSIIVGALLAFKGLM